MPIQGTSRAETLSYIRSMLGELRKLAKNERHDMLAFLIEMALVEANDSIGSNGDCASESRSHIQ